MMDGGLNNHDTEPKIKKSKKKIFLIFFALVLALVVSYAFFIFWRFHSISGKISIENESSIPLLQSFQNMIASTFSSKHKFLEGEKEGRINILLLGIAGKNYPGKNLTDTIMIMSIDTNRKKIALLSIPRDLYVKVSGQDYSSKINQIYQAGIQNDEGVSLIEDTVEEITGLNIQYYLIADFDGFKKVIDDIGGINVTVEKDIYDTRYPGPNYSYEVFEISKGSHQLDGETALKYARERHNDSEGDFGRAKRQQQVIQAVKNKVFSIETLLNPITLHKLLSTLEDHVRTNIDFEEIDSFIALSREVDTQNINTAVVDAWKKDSLLKVSHIQSGEIAAFILIPRVGNWSEIQELAGSIFDLDVIEKRREQISREEASVAIVNESGDNKLAGTLKTVLQDKLGIKRADIVTLKQQRLRDDTVIIDKTSGQKVYTLDELIKILPAKLVGQNDVIIDRSDITALGDYDVIAYLGNDIVSLYLFEEVSPEEYNQAQEESDEFQMIPIQPEMRR